MVFKAPLIEIASVNDASEMAAMSKDFVEPPGEWRWNAHQVRFSIRHDERLAIVARLPQRSVAGFAIMHYYPKAANLHLLVVHPDCRRQGIASQLVTWLEDVAVAAGILYTSLEVKETNASAQTFYENCGYRPLKQLKGYYHGNGHGLKFWKRHQRAKPLEVAYPFSAKFLEE